MSQTYIALTIGPIYKTLSNARATRELWGASYLFSYLMSKLLVECKPIDGITIISPFVPDKTLQIGAGLFPDRCYLLSQNEQALERVLKARKTVIEQLAVDIATHLTVPVIEVDTFLKQYLKVYVLEQEINAPNPLSTLNKVLDTLELQETIIPIQKRNYIADLLNRVNKSFLTKEAFGHGHNFNTLIEIGSQGLAAIDKNKYDGILQRTLSAQKNSETNTLDDEANTIKELKKEGNFKDQFRTYHKYICIVHADGDNVGAAICNLENNEQIGIFSEELYRFGIIAVELINKYKGLPTYAGGDDLLFFAPMMSGYDMADAVPLTNPKTGSTIFDLLDRLDAAFADMKNKVEERLGKEIDTPDKPLRLSYGISVSHYKFPMGEAIIKSRNLCFDDAKKTKNAIALQVLKHSGQYWDTVLQKDSEVHKLFKAMLSSQLDKGDQMLKSVLHKLDDSRAIFEKIGTDKERIANYLKNSFDEDVHKTHEIKEYFKDVVVLIYTVLNEKPDTPIQTRLDKVYALLSTIHFLKRKDND